MDFGERLLKPFFAVVNLSLPRIKLRGDPAPQGAFAAPTWGCLGRAAPHASSYWSLSSPSKRACRAWIGRRNGRCPLKGVTTLHFPMAVTKPSLGFQAILRGTRGA